MLANKEFREDIRLGFAHLQDYVRPGGRLNLTDINVHAEDFVGGVLTTHPFAPRTDVRRLDLPKVLPYPVEEELDYLLLILQYLGAPERFNSCRSIGPKLNGTAKHHPLAVVV